MILADTSVWVEHLRTAQPRFVRALQAGLVCVHPFVRGELACGNLRNRRTVLDLLERLPASVVATDSEVTALIEQRSLTGRGIGWVDAHLAASAMLSGPARLWSHDRRLVGVAGELGIGFDGSV